MGRMVAWPVAVVLALGACGGGEAEVPAYADPSAMSSKAWGPLGITNCGAVDEAATMEGAHFVICNTGSGEVRFIAAESESAAEAQIRVAEVFGLVAERHGSWVVAAESQELLDRAVAALS